MRILSQGGRIDIPYEQCGLIVFFNELFSGNWDINANIGGNKAYKMAEYSTEAKARKAMEMLHEAYMVHFQYKTMTAEQKRFFSTAQMKKNKKRYMACSVFPMMMKWRCDMNIGTLEQVRKDMEHGIYNMTDNGKCTGCGNCCSNLLPMTGKEIKIIRHYIKKHNIKECKHGIPLANPILDMTCPFLNMDKKTEKCTIYSVRPAICRCFICSEPHGALKHKELYRGIRKPVNVRETFYGRD